MSSTRFRFPTKTPTKSFFTMAELIAVMAITAILLTITIKIMKTDPTKANAQVIGSALSYAKAYATSELSDTDSNSDGFADETAIVIIDADSNMVYVKKLNTSTSVYEDIREHKMASGSFVADTSDPPAKTSFIIGFTNKGEPIKVSPPSPILTVPSQVDLLPIESQEIITLSKEGTDIRQTLRVKPFTGKITYY